MVTKGIRWEDFYRVGVESFEQLGVCKEWNQFVFGKLAISRTRIVNDMPACSFCKTPIDNAGELLVPGGSVLFCGEGKCYQQLIFAFDIQNVIAYPMRKVLFVKPTNERAKVTHKKRWQVIKRDNFRCVACGSSDNLVIDHKIPICKGGTSDNDNLQTLCFVCNSGKGGE